MKQNVGSDAKTAVHDFWNAAPCGLVYASGADLKSQLRAHAEARYALEPYIATFSQFQELGRGRDVLEIGVGMGADHLEWAKVRPESLSGVDLTEAAIEHTSNRLALEGYKSDLQVADAEHLPFMDSTFDTVYSYGVLHHSPNTVAAIREVFRVLRPGGTAKIMIYHLHSLVGAMLWLRYGAFRGLSLREVYSRYLESPGTKAYTTQEASALMRQAGFTNFTVKPQLGPGDLLEGAVGQRHRGAVLTLVRSVWPRWAIRRWARHWGLGLLITARR